MSIAETRTWLKSRAESIKDMHGYTHPMQAYDYPCIVFDIVGANYETPGVTLVQFKAYLLAMAGDAEKGYEDLDEYIDATDGHSVKAALEANVENYPVDYVVVKSCDDVGLVEFRGQRYYGAEFTVEVGAR